MIILSVGIMVVCAIPLARSSEIRMDPNRSRPLLVGFSVGMAISFGWMSAYLPAAIMVTFVMGFATSMWGLYLGAMMAKTSTNREYLVRNLILGAGAGLVLCIIVYGFACVGWKFHGKGTTFWLTVILNLLSSVYIGYVIAYVVVPGAGDCENGDYIWAVMKVYMHIGIMTVIFVTILVSLFTREKKEGEPSSEPDEDSSAEEK